VATLHVACAAEGAYDAHSAAMLHSVARRRGALDLHVHYLHGPSFPPRSVERLRDMLDDLGAGSTFHLIGPDCVAGLPVVSMFTAAMWYRIFLPELVPESDRVLYLDVDTVAVDSLEPLWATDLRDHYVGAVTNVFMPHHVHRPASLGLTRGTYFNSGVLLFNLEAMRRDSCTQALRDYAIERGEAIEWPDQDALNAVLGARRLPLHPRWNCMNSLRFDWASDVFGADAVAEALARPAIRHFEGPGENKPWHHGAPRADRDLYRAHRRETPWPRLRLEGRPSRMRRVARRIRRRVSA
jgi:lipopolysaccharide biosynthesis glycosyltransferase